MATQTQTKKIGGAAAAKQAGGAVAAKATETKEKKTGKLPFDFKVATQTDGSVIKLDEDGRLTAAPANWDIKKHKPLKSKMFADDGVFLDYKAMQYDQRAGMLKVTADKYRTDAENFRKFGDPEKRKSMKKMEKIADQFISLQAALSGDGGGEIDIPSLEQLLQKAKEKAAAKAANPAAPAKK